MAYYDDDDEDIIVIITITAFIRNYRVRGGIVINFFSGAHSGSINHRFVIIPGPEGTGAP